MTDVQRACFTHSLDSSRSLKRFKFGKFGKQTPFEARWAVTWELELAYCGDAGIATDELIRDRATVIPVCLDRKLRPDFTTEMRAELEKIWFEIQRELKLRRAPTYSEVVMVALSTLTHTPNFRTVT